MQINGLQSASSIHSLAGTQRTKSASQPKQRRRHHRSRQMNWSCRQRLKRSAMFKPLAAPRASVVCAWTRSTRFAKPSLTGLMRHPKNCRLLWTVCSIHSLRSVVAQGRRSSNRVRAWLRWRIGESCRVSLTDARCAADGMTFLVRLTHA